VAYFVQLKAYRSLSPLFLGTPVIRRTDAFEEGNLIKVVTGISGPAIYRQVYTDGVRSGHFRHKVPGDGAAPPLEDGSMPGDLTGWVDASPTSVYSLDDGFQRAAGLEYLTAATWATGRYRDRKVELDLMNDVDAGLAVRTRLVEMFAPRGGTVVDVSGPDEVAVLMERASTWLDRWVPHLEGGVNTFLKRPEVVDDIGRENSIRIVLASKGVEEIPRALGIPIPVP
jgi:hypothetical protein